MNKFKTTIQLKRSDICNLMLACLAAKELSNNDECKMWDRLRETLKSQLEEFDRHLDDEIENEYLQHDVSLFSCKRTDLLG